MGGVITMTIQKPDFNQIFASQAPDADKPPVFNNYNGGWGDESRPNNGKPTIKGFNYLQQLTDTKLLWFKQNAILPYDSDTDYPVGTVTLKDGRFKQWDGTNWINFGQDDDALKSSNNLSDLPNKATARNNLDVYSKIEVDDTISSAIPPETPDATETVAGKAKIATTEIAQAGVNDTDFLTAKKLRDAFKSPLLGLNQKWVDKKTSRVANTSYQNNTGKNLYFAGSGANEVSGQVSQDGVTWVAQFYLGRTGTVSGGGVGIVPSQWFYRISGGFSTWWEMEDV